MNYKLIVGWLYPDLMSTYGDRGNIISLTKRCQWRGIAVDLVQISIDSSAKLLAQCDLLFMGGAQDRQQKIVSDDLRKDKTKVLSELIENNIPGLYICGAYQFLGKYYKEADGTIINGLGILDLYTENPGLESKRLIGNIAVDIGDLALQHYNHKENELPIHQTLVGFENHGGRTYLGKNIKPLGKVINGFGNNGTDQTEGAIYKNSIGSYLHGPILPKNPHLADYLIRKALAVKYKDDKPLERLMDSLEILAHKAVLKNG